MEKAINFKILVDTREKQYLHIVSYFDLKKIPWEKRGLKSGDYAIEVEGVLQPILIERKHGLDELCGNFTKNRKRFQREFERAKGQTKILLIEDSNYTDIISHNYKSRMSPKALLASLLSFQFRYDLKIFFMPRENAGQFIYYTFYYFCKNRGNF